MEKVNQKAGVPRLTTFFHLYLVKEVVAKDVERVENDVNLEEREENLVKKDVNLDVKKSDNHIYFSYCSIYEFFFKNIW